MPFSLIAQVVCDPAISAATNRISESGYSYDANGSLTANAAGERFGYDGESHQTEFFNANNSGSTPDGTYVYDGEGKRVKKETSSETTIFVYDAAGKVVAEYSTTLATVQQVSYLTQDHLGSPRVTTNENGEVTNRKDFAAFGDEVVSAQRVSGNKYVSTPDEVRQDYTGYEKDEESGLEFAQARYYNPTHGRFTSVDPLVASATIRNPQTFNRYSYGLNSPYKFTDPLGLLSEYTTGACGERCPNSDGSSGGWSSDYYSGQLNGAQERMIKEFIGLFGQAAWDALVTGEKTSAKEENRPTPSTNVATASGDEYVDGLAVFDLKYKGSNARRVSEIGDNFFAYYGDGAEFALSLVTNDENRTVLTNYEATVDIGGFNSPKETFHVDRGENVQFTLFLDLKSAFAKSEAGIPNNEPTMNDPTSKNFEGTITVVSGQRTTAIKFETTIHRNESGVIWADRITVTNFNILVPIARPN